MIDFFDLMMRGVRFTFSFPLFRPPHAPTRTRRFFTTQQCGAVPMACGVVGAFRLSYMCVSLAHDATNTLRHVALCSRNVHQQQQL